MPGCFGFANRALRLAAVALLAVSASSCTSLLLGNGQTAGRPTGTDSRSASTLVSDQRITAIIRNRFEADDDLSEAALRIDTVNGVVTLRGSIDSFVLREQAVRLAADVPGVERVANQIVISR
jgi:osmotically-inducible protein OsmY